MSTPKSSGVVVAGTVATHSATGNWQQWKTSAAGMFIIQRFSVGYRTRGENCRSDAAHTESRTNDSLLVAATYIEQRGVEVPVASRRCRWQYLGLLAERAHAQPLRQKCFSLRHSKQLTTLEPRVITVDKNAAYPTAINELIAQQELHQNVALRQQKYLNNIIAPDNRGSKRLVNPHLWDSPHLTQRRRSLKGAEAMNIVRKGQSSWSSQRSRQPTGLHQPNLWSSCIVNSRILRVFYPAKVFATQPFL